MGKPYRISSYQWHGESVRIHRVDKSRCCEYKARGILCIYEVEIPEYPPEEGMTGECWHKGGFETSKDAFNIAMKKIEAMNKPGRAIAKLQELSDAQAELLEAANRQALFVERVALLDAEEREIDSDIIAARERVDDLKANLSIISVPPDDPSDGTPGDFLDNTRNQDACKAAMVRHFIKDNPCEMITFRAAHKEFNRDGKDDHYIVLYQGEQEKIYEEGGN